MIRYAVVHYSTLRHKWIVDIDTPNMATAARKAVALEGRFRVVVKSYNDTHSVLAKDGSRVPRKSSKRQAAQRN